MHRAIGRSSIRIAAAILPRFRVPRGILGAAMTGPRWRTPGEAAERRINTLGAALGVRPIVSMTRGASRALSGGTEGHASSTLDGAESERRTIQIGEIEVSVRAPANPALVPAAFGDAEGESQEVLEHLRWMLQKFTLHQDMFLIGAPGPRRRRLALHFCEVLCRPAQSPCPRFCRHHLLFLRLLSVHVHPLSWQ
jgi:hypothetical protein